MPSSRPSLYEIVGDWSSALQTLYTTALPQGVKEKAHGIKISVNPEKNEFPMRTPQRGRRVSRLQILLVFFVVSTLASILLVSVRLHTLEVPAADHHWWHEQSRAVRQLGRNARTVAYAVSISSCGSTRFSDGAAVLQHSIRTATNMTNAYDYHLYAIVHPEAESCGRDLEDLGFEILIREIPVQVHEIQGEYLRSRIEDNGCCGAKELIKLEAFTLTKYPLVVHLDLDVMMMKPMDKLFDFMLGRTVHNSSDNQVGLMWPDRAIPEYIEAAFTKDYNTAPPKRQNKPVQGGLLVIRPSMKTYHDFCELLRIGDFRNRTGWGGVVKPSYGAMTIQGILPYYYDVLHNLTKSVELNRCIYNSMADNPRDKDTKGEVVHGKCRTGMKECEDCRARPIEDVVNFHFTCCQKPWWCLQLNHDNLNQRMCRRMTHIWYINRFELEQSWGRNGTGNGTFDSDHFFGNCWRRGQKGYMEIEKPFPILTALWRRNNEPFSRMSSQVYDVDNCDARLTEYVDDDRLVVSCLIPIQSLGTVPKHASNYAYTAALSWRDDGDTSVGDLEVKEPSSQMTV